jgi:23S rRNA pseudouridine2605 synthase
VNGVVERDPARWIDPRADHVAVDGAPASDQAERVVLVLHKPAGFVTTRVDPGGRPTVYDLLGDVGHWVFPVGRLDRDTSGLLVLTNDHRLGERLSSPEAHVEKAYHARVRGIPDAEALRALREGIPLDDGAPTRPARVSVLGTLRGSTWLELVLTQGRNRQVRRMAAAVGHEVLELVRVRVGGLELRGLGLAVGEWRALSPAELLRLSSSRTASPVSSPGRSPRPAGAPAAPAPAPRTPPAAPARDAAAARPCGSDPRRHGR